MNEPEKRVPVISPSDALDTVYRDLVQIHYGLAEPGPTEHSETAMWAMRELRGVRNDIQAIRKAQPTASQD